MFISIVIFFLHFIIFKYLIKMTHQHRKNSRIDRFSSDIKQHFRHLNPRSLETTYTHLGDASALRETVPDPEHRLSTERQIPESSYQRWPHGNNRKVIREQTSNPVRLPIFMYIYERRSEARRGALPPRRALMTFVPATLISGALITHELSPMVFVDG